MAKETKGNKHALPDRILVSMSIDRTIELLLIFLVTVLPLPLSLLSIDHYAVVVSITGHYGSLVSMETLVVIASFDTDKSVRSIFMLWCMFIYFFFFEQKKTLRAL